MGDRLFSKVLQKVRGFDHMYRKNFACSFISLIFNLLKSRVQTTTGVVFDEIIESNKNSRACLKHIQDVEDLRTPNNLDFWGIQNLSELFINSQNLQAVFAIFDFLVCLSFHFPFLCF